MAHSGREGNRGLDEKNEPESATLWGALASILCGNIRGGANASSNAPRAVVGVRGLGKLKKEKGTHNLNCTGAT